MATKKTHTKPGTAKAPALPSMADTIPVAGKEPLTPAETMGGFIKQGAHAPGGVQGTVKTIPLAHVYRAPGFNTRQRFDESELRELAGSMSKNGQLQDIVVIGETFAEGERFALVAGERRVRAAELLGWQYIRALVRPPVDFADALGWQADENGKRVDIMPYERAERAMQLYEMGMKQARIGEILGISQPAVANDIAIVKGLAPEIYEAWKDHPGAARIAVEICRLPHEEQRARWAAYTGLGASGAGDDDPKPPRTPRDRDPNRATKGDVAALETMLMWAVVNGYAAANPAFGAFADGIIYALAYLKDKRTPLPLNVRATMTEAMAAHDKAMADAKKAAKKGKKADAKAEAENKREESAEAEAAISEGKAAE